MTLDKINALFFFSYQDFLNKWWVFNTLTELPFSFYISKKKLQSLASENHKPAPTSFHCSPLKTSTRKLIFCEAFPDLGKWVTREFKAKVNIFTQYDGPFFTLGHTLRQNIQRHGLSDTPTWSLKSGQGQKGKSDFILLLTVAVR